MAGVLGLGALGSIAMAPAAEAALGDPTIPSAPSTKLYLALSTIPGSVTVVGFAGQIELLTFGWGAQNSSDPLASASGAGSGKASPDEVVLAARSDIHSPKIVGALNAGSRLATAKISCTTSGTKPYTFMTLTFSTVVVTDYVITPDATTGYPLDVVHLKFVKESITYTPQKPDGTAGTAVTTGFDYSTGKAG